MKRTHFWLNENFLGKTDRKSWGVSLNTKTSDLTFDPLYKETYLNMMDGESPNQETSETTETTNQTDTNNNSNQVCVLCVLI